jgi:thiol-disulfide isomerase/thioredoxin
MVADDGERDEDVAQLLVVHARDARGLDNARSSGRLERFGSLWAAAPSSEVQMIQPPAVSRGARFALRLTANRVDAIPERWRARPRRHVATLGAMAMTMLVTGCASNQFRLANPRQRERDEAALANIPPPAPRGGAAPMAPVAVATVPAMPQSAPGAVAAGPASPLAGSPLATLPPSTAGPGLGVAPPTALAPDPLADNPHPNETGPMNRRLLARTPAPGAPGSSLNLTADGPSLVGRVVNAIGRPAPYSSIRVMEVGQPSRVVAEVAAAADGTFHIHLLRVGAQYELVAVSSDAGEKLMGTTIAVPPDTGVVIQLNRPYASTRSPLGTPLDRPAGGALMTPRTGGAGSASLVPTVGRVVVTVPTLLRETESQGRLALPTSPATASEVAVVTPTPAPIVAPTAAPPSPPIVTANPTATRDVVPTPSSPREQEGVTLEVNAVAENDAAAPGSSTTNGPASIPRAFAGTPLERLTIWDATGAERELGELAGDVIMLDFFGSWCGPCRRSIPKLNALWQSYEGRGLAIVGVACEQGPASDAIGRAQVVRRELGIIYPVVAAPLEAPSPLRAHLGVRQYPTLVLLSRKGELLFHGVGADADGFRRLERAIDAALAPGGAAR